MAIEYVMPSKKIEQKLLDRGITLEDVVECFQNKTGKVLVDARAKNQTVPPTLWFISETDANRVLKVAFIYFPVDQEVHIKSAYEADFEDIQYYEDHG